MSEKKSLPGTEVEVSVVRGLNGDDFKKVVAWLSRNGAAVLYADGGTVEYVI